MNDVHFQSLEMLHWLWLLPVVAGLFVFASMRRRKALEAFIEAGLLERIKITVSPVLSSRARSL